MAGLSNDLWERIIPLLSYPQTSVLEHTSSFFRKFLAKDKAIREYQYLLGDIIGREQKDIDEIIKQLHNNNNKEVEKRLYYYSFGDGTKKVKEVKYLREGILQFSEMAVAREMWDGSLLENGQKGKKIKKCEKQNCTKWSREPDHLELCDKHFEEKYETSFLYRYQMYKEFNSELENTGGESYECTESSWREDMFTITGKKRFFPFIPLRMIFAFCSFGMGGNFAWGLWLGTPENENENKRKRREEPVMPPHSRLKSNKR